MALRTNRLNAQGYMGGIFAGGTELWAVRRLDLLKNMYAGEGGIDDKSGIPNGYNTGAFLLPLKPGGMSSYNPAILNLVKADADAKMGRNLEASGTLSITVVNAQADQIISMEATGSCAISTADAALSAGVEMVASGSLTITGDLSLGGIIPVDGSGSCSITGDIDMSALAFMEAVAGGPTPLSPEGLAVAVWSEDLTDYNTVSTAGKVLKDAGGAGNPWAADLASNNTAGTFGWLVQKLLKLTSYLGLK